MHLIRNAILPYYQSFWTSTSAIALGNSEKPLSNILKGPLKARLKRPLELVKVVESYLEESKALYVVIAPWNKVINRLYKAAHSRKASRGDSIMELLRGEIKALVAEVRKVQGYRLAKPLYNVVAANLASSAIVVLDRAAREVLVQIEGELKEH